MAPRVEAQVTGRVMRIEKSVGDVVEEEEVLLILESMKMECSIQAPSDGRIEKLLVGVDDTVEEGDELVVIAAIDPDEREPDNDDTQ